jgi:hypothetical protein
VSELDRAPDLIQPVVGFRQWRLTDGGLGAIACEEVWTEAFAIARCRTGAHPDEPAPVSDCTCGLYAWYRPCPRTASTGELVAGAVVLWGAVELHVTGMRAQYGKIVALALPLSRWGKRERLLSVAERFGVPAVPHRALRRVAAEHGAPVPDSLRPPPELLPHPYLRAGVVPRAIDSARARVSGAA